MITYRIATLDDCATLTQIRMDNINKYLQNATEDEMETLRKNIYQHFTHDMNEGTLITYVACDGDKIVGTCGLTFFNATPSPTNITGKQGYITNMYTDPEYRGRGVGTKLFALTKEAAIARNCGRLVLYKTKMAEGIYKKFGFEDSIGYMTWSEVHT
ncbi:MAG: GNAT family N-acetyltransferase [Defluviitaleaceae bacterium]|nr:GNAT family N-acetyltransferase [Defluviitaleaceae bacterium]MCL2274684.1 GNAT family N-acetyltransferase [Defluviitaleaceae bacterium]MCL2275755.1 GNAT family N-acetyltransferase [Defluviitaleaceae bacterium]